MNIIYCTVTIVAVVEVSNRDIILRLLYNYIPRVSKPGLPNSEKIVIINNNKHLSTQEAQEGTLIEVHVVRAFEEYRGMYMSSSTNDDPYVINNVNVLSILECDDNMIIQFDGWRSTSRNEYMNACIDFHLLYTHHALMLTYAWMEFANGNNIERAVDFIVGK